MLFKNDIFELDGVPMRLLSANALLDTAWCIRVNDGQHWPNLLSYMEIGNLLALNAEPARERKISRACQNKCDTAWKRLEPLLLKHGESLLEARTRNALITEYAQEYGCSPVTIRKDLRRYWQRGQNKSALMPDYDQSGNNRSCASGKAMSVTAGRGRKRKDGASTYQLTGDDLQKMRRLIEHQFLKDQRITLTDTYTELVKAHYRYEDRNQQRFINPIGDRPTERQFRYFLKKHFNIEVLLRSRLGDSDYERDHRKVLGTVLNDCLGVGHLYEIDATIADVYLVSSEDPSKIVGKPTLYLIIDRKSRLIVGFYFGLENPSWNAALQAILSISEDKFALCQRYGVDYDPEDWPAHQVMPQEFLADRGDMISHASTNIADGLHISVTNVPSKRPDWKPLVECGFRLLHHTLRPVTPAYDPPSNATRRRGKHYEKDACLTVHEFGNLLLNAIIAHNRREILDYDLTPAELNSGVRPSPVQLWNYGIVTRAGVLTRFSEEKVRFELLRKDKAIITEHGIEFKGCFYSCPEAIAQKWFETARKSRFKVSVSFDPRLVDQIYVHALGGKGRPYLASLTERSGKYSSLSFDEVQYYECLRKQIRRESEHERLQNTVDFREKTQSVIDGAKKRLKAAQPKTSRSARRADTKPARHAELSEERKSSARILPTTAQEPSVVSEPVTTAASTLEQNRLAQIRARMLA